VEVIGNEIVVIAVVSKGANLWEAEVIEVVHFCLFAEYRSGDPTDEAELTRAIPGSDRGVVIARLRPWSFFRIVEERLMQGEICRVRCRSARRTARSR